MDKNFIGYSHPANVISVSDYYVGDLLKTGQYYNDLQTAVDEAQVGATVVSYNIPVPYTKRDGIGVVFARNASSPRVWEGLMLQSGTTAPVVTKELRNDFGVRLSSVMAYDGVGRYTLAFRTPVIDDDPSLQQLKQRVVSMPMSAIPPNISNGFIIGHDTGHSTRAFAFYVSDRDGNILNNLMNDGNGGGVFFRVEVRDVLPPLINQ